MVSYSGVPMTQNQQDQAVIRHFALTDHNVRSKQAPGTRKICLLNTTLCVISVCVHNSLLKVKLSIFYQPKKTFLREFELATTKTGYKLTTNPATESVSSPDKTDTPNYRMCMTNLTFESSDQKISHKTVVRDIIPVVMGRCHPGLLLMVLVVIILNINTIILGSSCSYKIV